MRSSLEYISNSNATCEQTISYEKSKHKMSTYWCQTQALSNLLHLVDDRLYDPKQNYTTLDILNRFIVYIPSVRYSPKASVDPYESGPIKLHVSHPNVSFYQRQKTLIEDVTGLVKTTNTSSSMCTQTC